MQHKQAPHALHEAATGKDAITLVGDLPSRLPPRAYITAVEPQVEQGRYAVKRVQGEPLTITAAVVTDGHDLVRATIHWRRVVGKKTLDVRSAPLSPIGNDEFRATIAFEAIGRYEFKVEASIDRFATWSRGLYRKLKAGDREVKADLQTGFLLLQGFEPYLSGEEKKRWAPKQEALKQWAAGEPPEHAEFVAWLRDPDLREWAAKVPDPTSRTESPVWYPVVVERPRARFSAWYEFFPRSTSPEQGRAGTFRDCIRFVEHAAGLGFNVVYLPPIHPIGKTARKGKNNTLNPEPDDVGSPWAIGNEDGGFYEVNPDLGTLEDFRNLVETARTYNCEIAMDIAFQCSPDHPYVKEHPEWFLHRPDGTIAYAENPPKKYQDIYPFDFESQDWRGLWNELRGVVLHWVRQGVKIFRVDNPHTKPFRFWEWLIASVQQDHPDVLFLAEAFSRPHVMDHLAKIGFSQSYTYFTWRETKWELTQYLNELTTPPRVNYFRPNFWPNTPDILPRHLKHRGPLVHKQRLVLAATLTSNYGIYGPVYEQCVSLPLREDKEEYLDSEKYEVKYWDLGRRDTLAPFLKRVNQIREQNPALQNDRSLRFVEVSNDQLLAYLKREGTNCVLVVVNLDEHHPAAGMVDVPIHDLGISPDQEYEVYDLLNDAHYYWRGWKNYVELRPAITPAHVFRITLPEPESETRELWDDDSLPFRGE